MQMLSFMQIVFRNMVWMSLFLQTPASLIMPSFLEYSRGRLWITD
uniref:Alternative protein CADPS2 n=1 Tax=Homo sapiens TaxID=9606 RepID=L8E7C0_HUMAN|nr:alternative protein CADPS2 [Homo sapiens]